MSPQLWILQGGEVLTPALSPVSLVHLSWTLTFSGQQFSSLSAEVPAPW